MKYLRSRPPAEPYSAARIWWTFAATFVPVTLLFVILGREAFFARPMYEIGDFAAYAFRIESAKHLSELYGNYSRFGFSHPGPAFFYAYALGDLLFRDLLHVAPAALNAYLLAAAVLQAAILSLALALMAELAEGSRRVFIVSALGIGLVGVAILGNPAFDIWTPYPLVFTFVLLLAAAVAVALGWAGPLPILVLAGGLLIHGHVAQPLFVVPITFAAYVALLLRRRHGPGLGVRGFWRATRGPHLWALAVMVPFALPLVIDAVRGGDSNIADIVRYLEQDNPTSTWGRALFYVLAFLSFRGHGNGTVLDIAPDERLLFLANALPPLALWLAVVAIPAWFLLRRRRGAGVRPADIVAVTAQPARFLATYYAFVTAAAILTLVWAKMQYGEPFAYNAFFFNGAMYVAAMPIAIAAARIPPFAARRVFIPAVAGLFAVALISPPPFEHVTTLGAPPGDDSGRQLHESVARVITEYDEPPSSIALEFRREDWQQAFGVALALDRLGIPFFVSPEWAPVFGDHHVSGSASAAGRGAVTWTLTEPGVERSEQRLSDHVALVITEPGNDPPEPGSP